MNVFRGHLKNSSNNETGISARMSLLMNKYLLVDFFPSFYSKIKEEQLNIVAEGILLLFFHSVMIGM